MIPLTPMLDRRAITTGALAAPLLGLAACKTIPEPAGPQCDAPQVSGVDWIPDVAHPVGWGMERLTTAEGAPRPMTIWYPSARILPPTPMLRSCLGRWPVVVLLHGDPPAGSVWLSGQRTDYNEAFFRFAIALARSGYVVIAPRRAPGVVTTDNVAERLAAAQQDVAFVRAQWREAKFVSRTAPVTLMGHSYGAIEATILASQWAEVGALVSLGGGFLRQDFAFGSLRQVLERLRCPSLFMFAANDPGEALDAKVGQTVPWSLVPGRSYVATYTGEHFDYLDPSVPYTSARGPCQLIGRLGADLAALFVAAHIQSLTTVPETLRKPVVTLTPKQEALAVQHLTTIDKPWGADCRITPTWRLNGQEGGRTIG